jgi:hypothetical protein
LNRTELILIKLNILDVNLEAIGSMIYKTNYKNVIVSVEQLNTHCSKNSMQEDPRFPLCSSSECWPSTHLLYIILSPFSQNNAILQ